MPGDGNRRATGESDIHLPSILAKLDAADKDVQREAVRTVRAAVEDEPRRCVPTVPKLRQLLERAPTGFDEHVVTCLAELAAEAPNDVAPSIDVVVRFARAETPQPGTSQALRCLTHVAERRPERVVDHVEDVVAVLEAADGVEPWGVRFFATLSVSYPRAVEPATPVLEDAIDRDPRGSADDALAALSRLARVEPSRVPTFLEAVEPLVGHADPALRVAAVDRLSEVVRDVPASLDGCGLELESTLEALAASDPSDEVRERAERALAALRRVGVSNR